MTKQVFNRRGFLCGATAMAFAHNRASAASGLQIQVFKDPNCGCCGAWVEILEDAGFDVSVTQRSNDALIQEKIQRQIPAAMASCHTAEIDGYAIEGHVPVADILRLLDQKPDAIGLAVPGMPFGSPGMGPDSQREAYDVFLMHRTGTSEVFASYVAA